ncbi:MULTISPECIES: dTDP-4-dehydrorhamnose reductase [Methanothermobacter]|jgi:dTDP-4-dehydrorhamnose reductase|uniref:dTDP-4-dehydrorhamnose reductase n=2 Tax=Methanothermobacter TaxID=145260 RepID=A0A371NBQ8_9EURY|nr:MULTISPECIES: dTDP-4-dehydrorhamnose reductase [Methanothermobacter]MDK2874471.1 dTDP-4-dehydrorhamnose reductase [Methanothermobacter sp.]MDN5373691.1 dTDP-4-dehydrorhamnose reductase [Methanothermobacter sp.]REE24610.1 dTDP-4-dehydrorhamnose reductase [Methanothermobacter defluvii]WBF08046.1 dTDP-4-dehydrorhamnose reductase [Methanothermobacter thermautotrophicus]BAZ99772.1 dTDP-4-dehydrorhamnose reductase [Methanothermobacter sp. EMTCatA1]
MKILITGSSGMLGSDLVDILSRRHEVVTSGSLDIRDLEGVMELLRETRPDAVVHAAAFTDVDCAETERDTAYQVNVLGTRNIAAAASAVGSSILYISTDYVFDGEKGDGYLEFDEPNPLNFYGKTKYLGEVSVRQLSERFYIVRTSWLFGRNGRNFVGTMVELAERGHEISVVDDQYGSPTYTRDLAASIGNLLERPAYGVYHLTNSGQCSWYEFAIDIFNELGMEVCLKPVKSHEFPRPARRPSFSVLRNYNWSMEGFKPLRNYRDALRDYIKDAGFVK